MLLKQSDEIWANVPEFWESRGMSPALIQAARIDPSLWPTQVAAFKQFPVTAVGAATQWAQAQRMALFRQGTGSLGLPASALLNVADAMSPLIIAPPNDLTALGVTLGKTAIGVTVDILSAIPVIGPIARAIGSLAMFLVALAEKPADVAREYLPPALVYDPDAEQSVMNNEVLTDLALADWTELFLPRQSNDLRLIEVENGWVLTSQDFSRGPGVGFLPGTQSILSATQALWHAKSKRAGGSLATSQDTGDFLAAPAQVMTAIEAQVQKSGAAMWSVDTRRVVSAWRDHYDAVMAFVADLWAHKGLKGTGLERLNGEQRHIVLQALVAPFHVGWLDGKPVRGILGANAWTPESPPDSIVDAFVLPWCDRLESRQRYYLDTIAVAYANPESATFQGTRNRSMRLQLWKNRALLLESPARWKVDRHDVVDSEYRAKLFSATVGDTLRDPSYGVAVPAVPPRLDGASVEPDQPLSPGGGVPFEGSAAELLGTTRDSGGGLALAFGLALLGYAGWRHVRRRGR